MSDLVKNVTDGVIEQTKTSTAKSSNNELGKDAFLKLLTTQMKYQDPLNPNTDTEYIAQLATFSQLEQLQNLGTVTTNSQAFGLVGKSVIVKTESASGNTTYVTGRVDFVNMSGSKAQLSINGSLYSIDKLDSVIDDTYIIEKGLPGITN
ncbi:MAG: flagellar hook capping FlgD N-terminal domain-containing protein, partial [Mobilitalea sp.]